MEALSLLPAKDRALLCGYLTASRLITDAGYGCDIDWAESLGCKKLTPQEVMSECAWVVVNSGFRFAVVRKLWPGLRVAFHDFDPALVDGSCVEPARRHLGHMGKLKAIVAIAAEVRRDCAAIVADAREPKKLMRLPYIGKITCYHLAKVLGADVVKPDVHLTRAAAAVATTPDELCRSIGALTGDRVTVVDSVLWRYGEQRVARGWADWPQLWQEE